MALLSSLLRLPTSLLVATSVLSFLSSASPLVDVSLEASFPAPPFILELLRVESAAAENASCYYPLLSSIASGAFSSAKNDEQLYSNFEQALQRDGHITNPGALASWRLSLAVHEAAPRIEAQYQLWRSSVEPSFQDLDTSKIKSVEVWTSDSGLCLDVRCTGLGLWQGAQGVLSKASFEFDKVTGGPNPWTLVIDPLDPEFGALYGKWSESLNRAATPYRVRYKPSQSHTPKALVVNGYGASLDLKRTDYIVIDDREAEAATSKTAQAGEVDLESADISDVKPLSSSELRTLGQNAASFIMADADPFSTLVKVSQDFPKHAAALALHEASEDFITEHKKNRDILLPDGYNLIWINGAQVDPREVDAFSLLENLRRERKLVKSVQGLGLSAQDAIDILSHPRIARLASSDSAQRYVTSDEPEGGKAILWMNDIEKDKRYKDWPTSNQALLQRLFPGQLPTLRRNLHSVVFPADLTDVKDVDDVLDTLQSLVKRLVPIRFGILPLTANDLQAEQAKIFYYLTDTYGLAAALEYLQESLPGAKILKPNENAFDKIIESRKVRPGRSVLAFSDVATSELVQAQIDASRAYLKRLGAHPDTVPIFCNGIVIPRADDWLQTVSQRISGDIRTMQEAVFEGTIDSETPLSSLYLSDAVARRNPLLIPESEADIKIVDLAQIHRSHASLLQDLHAFRSLSSASSDEGALFILDDFNKKEAQATLINSLKFALANHDIALTFIHQATSESSKFTVETLTQIQDSLKLDDNGLSEEQKDAAGKFLTGSLMSQSVVLATREAERHAFAADLGVRPQDSAIVFNGRVITPLPKGTVITSEDFETLTTYEKKKRIEAVQEAITGLDLVNKLSGEFAVAKLSAVVALSLVSDVPEGIFDASPGPRMSQFNKWESKHTLIEKGDRSSAVLHITASIDPSSEVAQRWVPILETLSELDETYVRIFLNPKDKLTELPTKRFYRHVLRSKPVFEQGELLEQSAVFGGIPKDALLTMALDIPPAWLVAPKESVYDLDNIKLNSVKAGGSIKAIYELQNILIEGHSRDPANGNPPRGAQLTLSTDKDTDFAGTIIMSNLGYFQFRANPGVYGLSLKKGASDLIFSLDSAGTMGWGVRPGDETTTVPLASFKGATLFPRLSRKAGMEMQDVLEMGDSAAAELASKGAEVADSLLAKVGLEKVKTGPLLGQAVRFGQKILSNAGVDLGGMQTSSKKQADINIFSVASGHLYERMLNIMMLSVMRHTEHSVKFWFIEQFLSPSFKKSISSLAEEYGFEYEMVTYKWPHWLRAQKEKQRTIWGYKILFLDVLFPLDLDKVIFVDADQIVRTDMYELVTHDLHGAPYGFTPMCDSRTEMEGFRFWKQGYWKNFLRGKPYHISALYVVDLKRFRQIAAGDRLRQQYHQLSADPNSLSNLDQDLPNNMQAHLPIHSLPQEWLWCETWCSDESLGDAKTIDLCNNPQTKEPKLDRARRQVPEWTTYDDEIAGVLKRTQARGQQASRAEDVPPPIQEQEQVQAQAAQAEQKHDEL